MDSKISNAIALKYPPVALIWSEQKPENIIQSKEQNWDCTMWLDRFWCALPGRIW